MDIAKLLGMADQLKEAVLGEIKISCQLSALIQECLDMHEDGVGDWKYLEQEFKKITGQK